ncbi:Protein of unknown function [Leuconostoc citreum]|nr:Protein of unknown function [Leuconostoc citreum LBAE C11]CCF27853.1 Protein of unknown function [Leuconostoc citreum LBAE E16]CDX67138.1 Protein of unknown function [Leuconostoc citreum]
MKGLADK